MKRYLRTFVIGLLVFALIGAGVAAAKTPRELPIEASSMAEAGIFLEEPTGPAKLSKDVAQSIAAQVGPILVSQAKAVTVRRVKYVNAVTGASQPAWVVTLHGVQVHLKGEPNSGRFHKQVHILISEEGKPIKRFSYQ